MNYESDPDSDANEIIMDGAYDYFDVMTPLEKLAAIKARTQNLKKKQLSMQGRLSVLLTEIKTPTPLIVVDGLTDESSDDGFILERSDESDTNGEQSTDVATQNSTKGNSNTKK